MAKIFKNSKYFQLFHTSKSTLHETVHLQREICIDFVRWGVITVSVFQSREVSVIRRSQCTVNNLGLRHLVRIMEVSVIGGVRCWRFHCILLAAMASNHTFMNYNSSGLHSHRLHTCYMYLGSLESLERLLVLIMGGANFHSLLSAHHLIGTYFLTIESDKCMCLLTRRYSILNQI